MTNTPPEHPALQLPAALRAHARGLLATEAATEIVIGHQTWLRRADFLTRFVSPGAGLTNDIQTASINWAEAIAALNAHQLPCSSGEDRMLRLAASLAAGIPVDLRDALTSLDPANSHLVANAVLHAGNHHTQPGRRL